MASVAVVMAVVTEAEKAEEVAQEHQIVIRGRHGGSEELKNRRGMALGSLVAPVVLCGMKMTSLKAPRSCCKELGPKPQAWEVGT